MSNKMGSRVTTEELVVASRGSGMIHGTLRTPPGSEPSAMVVIHPATAVQQRLYNGFASYLAEHGFAVVTYDYRGTGKSGAPKAHRHVRGRARAGLGLRRGGAARNGVHRLPCRGHSDRLVATGAGLAAPALAA